MLPPYVNKQGACVVGVIRGLSEKEVLFIDHYMTNGFDRKEAVKAAGFKTNTPGRYGANLLQRVAVQEEIDKRNESRASKFAVTELDVLEGLYREATLEGKGSTQNGRINAWVSIGKHLGMFQEKKQLAANQGNTINIMNYNTGEVKTDKEVEGEVLQATKDVSDADIVEGVKLVSYGDSE